MNKIKICKEGTTSNTITNRCNKNCTILQEKNPNTGRCRKICTETQTRNPDTQRCKKEKESKVKIDVKTKPKPTPTTKRTQTPKSVSTPKSTTKPTPTTKPDPNPTPLKTPTPKTETPEDIIIEAYDDPDFPIISYQQAQGNKINSILEIIDKLINKNSFIIITDLFKSNKLIIKTIFNKLYNKSGKAKDVKKAIDYIQNLILDLIIYVSGGEN